MTTLRAGVVGVGHLGQHHARLYAALPDSVLAGVTDQNAERGRMIAARHGARVFDDLADLLAQLPLGQLRQHGALAAAARELVEQAFSSPAVAEAHTAAFNQLTAGAAHPIERRP